MRNFKMILQYEGTRYQGWQKQDSTDNTIQGKLERLIEKMSLECSSEGQEVTIQVNGSGRTDAGVHAMGQTANFLLDTDWTTEHIMEYINTYLPYDIGVISLTEVPERFHSRLMAKGKTYRYRVINSTLPHVFERRYVYEYPEKLDMELMRQAAELLEGTHDFRAFTSAKKSKKSTIRTIEKIELEQKADEISFTFSGDGFLYHMVRILMGTILEVGTGKRTLENLQKVLADPNAKRDDTGFLVPAKGLMLMEVRY
ncbi:MAG: tRNA pseudouridine(38-40) synthase TruA [Lachnospiraceae bacterium]|nr:tRNA pseudouridine(38-40) synthase TruA [Lachnospiraceae bacterium]